MNETLRFLSRPTIASLFVIAVLISGRESVIQAHDGQKTRERAIEDFLLAQGIAASGGYIEWADANLSETGKGLVAGIDYAGIDYALLVAEGKASLGTQISGTMKERLLADGRAEVTIKLEIHNALAAVIAVDIS